MQILRRLLPANVPRMGARGGGGARRPAWTEERTGIAWCPGRLLLGALVWLSKVVKIELRFGFNKGGGQAMEVGMSRGGSSKPRRHFEHRAWSGPFPVEAARQAQHQPRLTPDSLP